MGQTSPYLEALLWCRCPAPLDTRWRCQFADFQQSAAEVMLFVMQTRRCGNHTARCSLDCPRRTAAVMQPVMLSPHSWCDVPKARPSGRVVMRPAGQVVMPPQLWLGHTEQASDYNCFCGCRLERSPGQAESLGDLVCWHSHRVRFRNAAHAGPSVDVYPKVTAGPSVDV